MQLASAGGGGILWVDASASLDAVPAELPPGLVVRVAEPEEALARLTDLHPSVVVTPWRLGATTGGTFLEQVRARAPAARRVLLLHRRELPEALLARADRSADQMLSQGALRTRSAAVAASLLGERFLGEASPQLLWSQSAVRRADGGAGRPWSDLQALLRFTASRLARQPVTYLRDPWRGASFRLLQMVLTSGEPFERLRDEILSGWGAPLKARGTAIDKSQRDSPVIEFFGRPERSQDIWVLHSQPDAAPHPTAAVPALEERRAVLAFLPWRDGRRITVTAGLWRPSDTLHDDGFMDALGVQLADEILEFPRLDLSALHDGNPIHFLPEYEWVMTRSYLGPDRRQRPTSFFNRHIFFGRRRQVPANISRHKTFFVDRVPPAIVPELAAFALLAMVDSLLTLWKVGEGTVREMNPLWRALLVDHAIAFLVAKNALTAAAVFIILRFHVLKMGRYALRLNLLAYGLLAAYWLWLIMDKR